MSRATSVPRSVPVPRQAAIVCTYALVFFGALPLILASLGARLDALFGWGPLGAAWRAAGLVAFGLGGAGTAWSMLLLRRRGRGWPISHLPPARFVADGLYRLVRHPIYVAYTIAFAGAGLALGSPGHAFGATGLLTAGWLIYALGFEEPKLLRRFGETYADYRSAVPALPVPGRRAVARLAGAIWTAARPAVERISNRVVLFRLGPTVWVTYGAMLAIGAITMASFTGALLVTGGLSPAVVTSYLLWLAVAMVIGGRLVWLAYQARALRESPLRVLRTVGFVSWGAILAAVVFPFLYGGSVPGGPFWLLDRTLMGLVACAVLGRLGCLTYGCCFGRESARGVCWTEPDAKVNRQLGPRGPVPRVPTQLLEAGWLLAILALAIGVTHAGVPAGTVSGLLLILYGVGRFAVDTLRDEDRFGAWRLTAGQGASLASAALGLAILFALRAPAGWSDPVTAGDLTAALSVWPAILACAFIVFLASGFHWQRVGRW